MWEQWLIAQGIRESGAGGLPPWPTRPHTTFPLGPGTSLWEWTELTGPQQPQVTLQRSEAASAWTLLPGHPNPICSALPGAHLPL